MRNYGMLLGIMVAGLGSCNSIHSPQRNPQQLYQASIADAAVVSPAKVLPLLPLIPNEQTRVVAWVAENRVPCGGAEHCDYVTGDYRIWVTLDDEVGRQCRQWHLRGDPLRERLEQLLGLPPGSPVQYRKTRFVTMQVASTNLQRACLGVNNSDAQHPVCTLGLPAGETNEVQQFVMQQMAGSYVMDNPAGPGYPFTRLGYTYDWHPEAVTKKHYGASEFLLAPKSQVNVLAITSTDDFCN
jgi:hypothetical protein